MIDLRNVKPNIVTTNLCDKIWLFYGEMATRKTSVACSFPRHLLFAYDIGYKLINGAMPVPMQTWSDFKSAVKQLDNKEVKENYDVIIIDTVGMAYQACYQYMLTRMGVEDPSEAGAYGIGWKKIRNEFEITLRSIVQKGYGLIMLAHSDEVEKEDKIRKEKVLTTKIDIDKRPDLIIKGLADFVLFLHKEPNDETGNPTVYAYSNLVNIDTKTRSRYFTDRFEFTYDNLKSELEKAIQKQYEVENTEMPNSFEENNPYMAEKKDFNKLKEDVINLVLELKDKQGKDVEEILTSIFKGIKLSELENTQENISKLSVAYASLSDLK